MKHLIAKSTENGNIDSEEFLRALLEWRNTPREGGLSPAQIVFGQPMRSFIPAHHTSFDPKWHKTRKEYDDKVLDQKLKSKDRYDRHSKPLPPIQSGTEVLVQHTVNKKKENVGTIVAKRRYRDFMIRTPSGKTKCRNRRFIRPSAMLKET